MTTKNFFLITITLLTLLVLTGLYSIANRTPDNPMPEQTPPTETKNNGKKEISSPPEFTSGKSRFSRGTCQQNSDCQVGGCSSEVCSSEDNIMSTCEYSEDFPGPDSHQCGCYNNVCGWKQK